MKKAYIGYQIYSAREEAEKDLDAVLGSLKAMGYDGVEFAGFYGHSAEEVKKMLDENGLSDIHLCPETMGKKGQMGDLEETLQFCLLEERFIPCLDFAHIHALHQGRLNKTADFEEVLDISENILGRERMRQMHVHFSTIEYTAAGEKRHRTFAESEYGPRFHHLAPLLKARDYTPRIICECKGTMAEDAAEMKKIWEAL